jgi:flagellar biosynthesis GTPase FlhF
MSDDETPQGNNESGAIAFLLENRSWLNGLSFIMILYAVWAVIEVLTNTYFTGMQIPPVTGVETNIDVTDTQRNNSGWVMASGAVFGLIGLAVQYIYKGAPMVDSSMAATAAMILDQATAGRVDEADLISKAEEAATVAAAEVAKETAEDTVIEMLDPDAGNEEGEEAEAEEPAEEEPEAEAEVEETVEEEPEAEAEVEETVEEEAEEVPEDRKKF